MLQLQSKVIFGILWPMIIAVVTFFPPTICSPTTAHVDVNESPKINDTNDLKGNNHSKKDLNQYNATADTRSIDTSEKMPKDGYKTILRKQIGSQLLDKYHKDFNGNDDNPVDQLTELSKDRNTSRISDHLMANEFDSSDSFASANISDGNHAIQQYSKDLVSGQTQASASTSSPVPQFILNNAQSLRITPSEYQKGFKQNRYKRSQYRNPNTLHSNMDDLLNIRRERRALRLKRNTNYEDFLASLASLAKEQEESDNYNAYPILSNDINIVPVSQALYSLLQDRYELNDNGYVDLDKLNQYYYPNNIPIVEIDSNGEPSSADDDINQELPAMVQPYAQQVIPVLPYTLPNRYQRIRRSYYRKYHNPYTIYEAMRRKKSANNYYYDTDNDLDGWGRIVADRNNQNGYEDSSDEANKIYSLASLLASTETNPDQLNEYAKRYKRSTKSNIRFM